MPRKLLNILFAILLLCGQVTVLLHATDLEAHPNPDNCEVCLLASPLGAAVPPSPLSLPAAQGVEIYFPLSTPVAVSPDAYTVLARGPPAFYFSQPS